MEVASKQVDSFRKQAAEGFMARSGLADTAVIRRWYQGLRGWFVVTNDDYKAVYLDFDHPHESFGAPDDPVISEDDEGRIDLIGRNGATGEHYFEQPEPMPVFPAAVPVPARDADNSVALALSQKFCIPSAVIANILRDHRAMVPISFQLEVDGVVVIETKMKMNVSPGDTFNVKLSGADLALFMPKAKPVSRDTERMDFIDKITVDYNGFASAWIGGAVGETIGGSSLREIIDSAMGELKNREVAK